jgi:hypothetical protein
MKRRSASLAAELRGLAISPSKRPKFLYCSRDAFTMGVAQRSDGSWVASSSGTKLCGMQR